ncbi:hypothetical protein CDAR_249251 [Caerostris darwini]|uniref:Uncharacterized protein n=1 Tax=Caerostris darwini TaxID=1538125 RepID=A0AAV4THZ2_9ARAC|nr:hypothetical protein CDAR_249251 [Caerostris darwini]
MNGTLPDDQLLTGKEFVLPPAEDRPSATLDRNLQNPNLVDFRITLSSKSQMYFSSNSHIIQRKLYLNLPNNPVLALNSVAFVMCFVFLAIGIISCVFLCRILRDENGGNQIPAENTISPDPETTLGNSSEAEPVFVYFENNKDDNGIATVLIHDENIPQVDSQNESVPVE